MTTEIRTAIAGAAHAIGGQARLVEWIKESELNERIFWSSIWPRLAPLRVEGKDGGAVKIDVTHRLSREEIAKQLEERGLPGFVFGVDKPEPLTIEHQPQPGNGKANGLDGEGDE